VVDPAEAALANGQRPAPSRRPGVVAPDVCDLGELGAGPVARALGPESDPGLRGCDFPSGKRDRSVYLACVRALVAGVDARDLYTRGHSERVARYARLIAVELGANPDEVATVELAGLLHDIGKLGVPEAMLLKAGPLDDAERAVMMGHAVFGADLLATANGGALEPVVPLVRHHHEWFDGRGYPDGLAGAAIPLGAQILAVAEAFDTMVTDRQYRARRSSAEAVAELRRGAGGQFHPQVVDALTRVLVASRDAGAGDGPVVEIDPPSSPRSHDDSPTAGRLGDARVVGLLVELAGLTRHIPDLEDYLARVCSLVRLRLGYEEVRFLLADRQRCELVVAALNGAEPGIATGDRLPSDGGSYGAVMGDGQARTVLDISRDPDRPGDRRDAAGSELVVPLVVGGETIGLIVAESRRVAGFSDADQAVLGAVAAQVAAAVHVAQLHDAAKRAAATDGLTGLLNHRAFYEALEQELALPGPLSVVLLDVEGLKRVNDTAGHLAGDALLRRVGEVIRLHVRAEDVVARYGGDEFALVLPRCDAKTAIKIAARIRRALLDSGGGREEPRTTVRYGVATSPQDGTLPRQLVGTADRRLYRMRDAADPTWEKVSAADCAVRDG
jgi:diguanylate cyclase (GGDEF)-like protein